MAASYKVVTKLDADKFGAWEEEAKFAPEPEFLAEIEKLGVKRIETQTRWRPSRRP